MGCCCPGRDWIAERGEAGAGAGERAAIVKSSIKSVSQGSLSQSIAARQVCCSARGRGSASATAYSCLLLSCLRAANHSFGIREADEPTMNRQCTCRCAPDFQLSGACCGCPCDRAVTLSVVADQHRVLLSFLASESCACACACALVGSVGYWLRVNRRVGDWDGNSSAPDEATFCS